ncbi:hypothetical protein AMTR_s00077p00164250 [Amborella trichopoda]|uniref:N-acetyltransferase ESCO zinc-finger domain-containing protein n=1 Tax=Amborella trichopoda TaxID=13333 RepID=W1P9I9_AMBTC|nr:hypothetical protein AMTR_s00077p00164250 [Amborella trichopoda]
MSGLFKQAKISSFFKPFATNDSSPLTNELEETANSRERKDILATYRRRTPINKPSCEQRDDDFTSDKEDEASWQESNPMSGTVNKKQNHSQCYLELGRSDLILHTCSLCGLQYSCGDEEDERVHKAFHKKYIQGVQFKGWHNERVICTYPDNGEHIVLILNGDPPTHRQRLEKRTPLQTNHCQVQEVAKIMVKELNLDDEWLVHKFCKVYLRISSQRIVGCLVAEPIRYAYKVISNCSCPSIIHSSSSSAKREFQNKKQRVETETIKRNPSNVKNSEKIADEFFGAAILCEMEPMPAVCGIRAIWVLASRRRMA